MQQLALEKNTDRLRLIVKGCVQGVGFRPHVYRVACALGLTGWVKNNGAGVLIEIAGKNVRHFLSMLQENLPPLAKVDHVEIDCLSDDDKNHNDFQILESESTTIDTMIGPDVAVCDECLRELFDPNSRFYLYPFLNCTHCGPRFTITRNLPYDRKQTSMDVFAMCEDCVVDYGDPRDRRYHAQPIACQQCGPQLSMPLADIARHIMQGDILAIKGLGGYQLICDARNVETIKKLRARKQRKTKPFALMVLNLASAQSIADCSSQEKIILASRERPIVLLKKRDSSLPDIIAPGLSDFGIMLPSTPLHYLLFYALSDRFREFNWLGQVCPVVLIVTSANAGKNPLIVDDAVAKTELKNIADHVVSHHRKIIARADDSVVRVINEKPMFIRRARGYVPSPIPLAHSVPCTLALGAQLKNTFCITRGNEAFVSPYIGDIENAETIEFLHESIEHLVKFLRVSPTRIACDLHPDFYTTRLAHSFDLPIFPVQHHHAHLVSVMAEHHLKEPVLGLALDGYGYGEEGSSWGGELFLLEGFKKQSIGHFYPLALPGGDRAVREPWRVALGILSDLHEKREVFERFSALGDIDTLQQMLDHNIHITRTSSCGRWFDAASALLGVQFHTHYEGEAAMKLESLVSQPEVLPNGWGIQEREFSLLPTFKYLLKCDPITGANIFHGTLIAGLADWLDKNGRRWNVNRVVLGGGCFLNKVLTEGLLSALKAKGLTGYVSEQLPANDSGLCLGQAWVAANNVLNKEI